MAEANPKPGVRPYPAVAGRAGEAHAPDAGDAGRAPRPDDARGRLHAPAAAAGCTVVLPHER